MELIEVDQNIVTEEQEVNPKDHQNTTKTNEKTKQTTTSNCKKFIYIPGIKDIKLQTYGYWKNSKWMPPPIINLVIIILQLVIYITDNYNPNCPERCLTKVKRICPTQKADIYRYYTYSLVHSSWDHVLINSICQFIFGTALEPLHGYRVFVIFFIGVISGSLAHSAFKSSTLVGSSAGAYALIFSWVSDVLLNWSEQQCPMVSLIPAIGFLAWDYYRIYINSKNVSCTAHLAGAIAGILAGIIILKNLKQNRCGIKVRIYAIILSVTYFAILILLNYYGLFENNDKMNEDL